MTKKDLSLAIGNDSKENLADYSESSEYFDHSFHGNPSYEESLDAVRGIMMGILLSIPIWALIIFLVFLK